MGEGAGGGKRGEEAWEGEAGGGSWRGSRKNDFQQGRRGIASVCLMLRFAIHFDSSLFT